MRNYPENTNASLTLELFTHLCIFEYYRASCIIIENFYVADNEDES